ncbi:MAG TPA: DUF5667 domain-containing protein [Nitrososphaera sp.]|nr:DUF5667 domain-containing protein [Nitrososphaera sp.]
MRKVSSLAIILLFALSASVPSVALAQAQELSDPGALPDDAFYGFKRFFESVVTAFTFGEEARANRALELAELRLAEAKAMVEMGKPQFVESLARDYEREIENAKEIMTSIGDGETKKGVSERVAVATSRHLEVLDEVREKVPDQAKIAIVAAKERSMTGNIEALRALAAEDPDRAAEIAMQVAENRALKAREAADRGDSEMAVEAAGEYMEYERFGQEISVIAQQVGKDPSRVRELVANATSIHMIVLQEVRDKVPDEARSSIEEAIAASEEERDWSLEERNGVPYNSTRQDDDDAAPEENDERGPPPSGVASGRP